MPAVIDIYSKLLGVQFVPVKADLWHPGELYLVVRAYIAKNPFATEAQAFAVWEADAKDDNGFIGYCYLDLFPRGEHFPS